MRSRFYNRQLSPAEINNMYIASGFSRRWPCPSNILGDFVVITWKLPITASVNAHTVGSGQSTGTNYVLETTTSLRPGTGWQPCTNLPVVISGNIFKLTFPVSDSAQFFRLRAK